MKVLTISRRERPFVDKVNRFSPPPLGEEMNTLMCNLMQAIALVSSLYDMLF